MKIDTHDSALPDAPEGFAPRKVAIARPAMGEEEWHALRGPVESGWLTQGPRVAEFEKAFAARHGVARGLAVTSCTTGLHLILAAMGIGPGDEVIVPAFTWVATANAVLYCGAEPVLCDVDPATFNIDPDDVARRVTKRTRAVMPVHLFGLCADMDALEAAAPGLPMICDAACAVGASYNGRPAGSLGLASSFSFHPRKPLTTGEGGMVSTDDEEIAERMNMLRNHGASISEEQRHAGPQPYFLPDFDLLGFNYRMTDLQGAVGLAQLARLDEFMAERRQLAAYYAGALADLSWLSVPVEPEGGGHGWQAFVCLVDEEQAPMERNEMMVRLEAMGVSTRPGTHALHTLGHLRDRYGFEPTDYPGALKSESASIAIPLHNTMEQGDAEYVVAALRSLDGEGA